MNLKICSIWAGTIGCFWKKENYINFNQLTIPWKEEPDRLQPMGSQWVEHYQVTNIFTFNLLIISSLEQNFSVFHLYGEKCLDLLEFFVKSASEGLNNIVLSLKSSHILEHEDGEG